MQRHSDAQENAMKKSSVFVFVIPLIVVGVIISGVAVWHTLSVSKSSKESSFPIHSDDIPLLPATSGKPVVGFGNLQSADPVSDLQAEYDSLIDDGGEAEFTKLENLVSAL